VSGVCGLLLDIGIAACSNPTQPWLHSWKICPVTCSVVAIKIKNMLLFVGNSPLLRVQ